MKDHRVVIKRRELNTMWEILKYLSHINISDAYLSIFMVKQKEHLPDRITFHVRSDTDGFVI